MRRINTYFTRLASRSRVRGSPSNSLSFEGNSSRLEYCMPNGNATLMIGCRKWNDAPQFGFRASRPPTQSPPSGKPDRGSWLMVWEAISWLWEVEPVETKVATCQRTSLLVFILSLVLPYNCSPLVESHLSLTYLSGQNLSYEMGSLLVVSGIWKYN